MEFWTSADNKFFSASIVLNVLSKKKMIGRRRKLARVKEKKNF